MPSKRRASTKAAQVIESAPHATESAAASTKASRFVAQLAEICADDTDGDDDAETLLRTAVEALKSGKLRRSLESDFDASLGQFRTLSQQQRAAQSQQQSGSKRRKLSNDDGQTDQSRFNACTATGYEAVRTSALSQSDSAVLQALAAEPGAPTDLIMALKCRSVNDSIDVNTTIQALIACLSSDYSAFSSVRSLASYAEAAYNAAITVVQQVAQRIESNTTVSVSCMASLHQLLTALQLKSQALHLRSTDVYSATLPQAETSQTDTSFEQALAYALAQYTLAIALLHAQKVSILADISAVTQGSNQFADDDDDGSTLTHSLQPAQHIPHVVTTMLPPTAAKVHFVLSVCATVDAISADKGIGASSTELLGDVCLTVAQQILHATGNEFDSSERYLAGILSVRAVSQLVQNSCKQEAALQRCRQAVSQALAMPAPGSLITLVNNMDATSLPHMVEPVWLALRTVVRSKKSVSFARQAVTRELLHGKHCSAEVCVALYTSLAVGVRSENASSTANTTHEVEDDAVSFYVDKGGFQSLREGIADESDIAVDNQALQAQRAESSDSQHD